MEFPVPTTAGLAEYLSIPENDLPPEAERLLKRSQTAINSLIQNRVKEANKKEDDYLNAIYAQVEFWMTIGESADIVSVPNFFSVGTFKMEGGLKALAPRAKRFLTISGLMYKGVSMK